MRIDNINERDKYKRTLGFMYGLILCFFILIFILLIEMVWKYGYNGEFMALCISMVLIIYAGILLNRLFRTEQREMDKRRKLDMTVNLEDKEHWRVIYNQISDRKKKISYMRHDMANHMQVISSLYERAGMKCPLETINQIASELSKTKTVKYCDNMLLDLTFEQRIKKLVSRGIEVDADIQLVGIEHIECEQLCLVFSMLIDYVGANLEAGQFMSMKVHKQGYTKEGMVLGWHFDTKASVNENVNMDMLLFLIKRMNGSLLVEKTVDRVNVTGMLEVIL